MNKTICAQFATKQEAEQALQQAKQQFPQLDNASVGSQCFQTQSTTMHVPPETFLDPARNGLDTPAYLTGPHSPAANFLNQQQTSGESYTVELNASAEYSQSMAMLLSRCGGQNIRIS